MKITKAQLKQVIEEELKAVLEEDDRCTRIAKSKYKVWPSAYASGAVVRCRDGKIWKDLKEEELTDDEEEELEQLDLVEELLEKQQLMYVRCKLSGDEDALMVAENMRESLRKMGMTRGTTVEQMFENMKGTIRKLKETLDN